MTVIVRRLGRGDAECFRDLRIQGFRLQEHEFRFSPDDEANVSMETTCARLETEFVVGAFDADELVGIGGLSRQLGSKLNHRALLWGMYIKPGYRGSGLSNDIMQMLLDFADKSGVVSVVLTVVNGNDAAARVYQRWGFEAYGLDRAAVKLADGSFVDELLMVRMSPRAYP